MSDIVGALAATAAPDDLEAIRGRAASLLNRLIDEAEHQLDHGTPRARQELIKTVLPAFLKEQAASAGGRELEVLRLQQEELFATLRNQLTSTPARDLSEIVQTAGGAPRGVIDAQGMVVDAPEEEPKAPADGHRTKPRSGAKRPPSAAKAAKAATRVKKAT